MGHDSFSPARSLGTQEIVPEHHLHLGARAWPHRELVAPERLRKRTRCVGVIGEHRVGALEVVVHEHRVIPRDEQRGISR